MYPWSSPGSLAQPFCEWENGHENTVDYLEWASMYRKRNSRPILARSRPLPRAAETGIRGILGAVGTGEGPWAAKTEDHPAGGASGDEGILYELR
jgi:hypothetical protein